MFIILLLFCYGLLIGSFLNAWIWRIHTNRKISRGRSMCPHCKTTLKWYELIPVISWLGLRGKCRTCHKSISIQYPLVELANALIWVALYSAIKPANLQSWLELIVWLAISSLLIAAFVYDAKWMLLPDQFMIPAIIIAALWCGLQWVVFGSQALIIQQLIGALLFAGFYFALWYFSGGKWLGDGDIRLALIMGLMLTPSQLVVAIFLCYLLGAFISLFLIASKLKTRKDAIAFGPFLILGMFLSFFFSNWLIGTYLGLFV